MKRKYDYKKTAEQYQKVSELDAEIRQTSNLFKRIRLLREQKETIAEITEIEKKMLLERVR